MKYAWELGIAPSWYAHKNHDDLTFCIWDDSIALTMWDSRGMELPNACSTILHQVNVEVEIGQNVFISRRVIR